MHLNNYYKSYYLCQISLNHSDDALKVCVKLAIVQKATIKKLPVDREKMAALGLFMGDETEDIQTNIQFNKDSWLFSSRRSSKKTSVAASNDESRRSSVAASNDASKRSSASFIAGLFGSLSRRMSRENSQPDSAIPETEKLAAQAIQEEQDEA